MINFYTVVNNLGYGVHAYNFMRALDSLEVEIALFPINFKTDFVNLLVHKWLKNQEKFSREDSSIMLFHENYMNRFSGKLRIGFPVFETGVTEMNLALLKSLDYILQPSDWGKQYLESKGCKNVFVIPEGYDEELYNNSSAINNIKSKSLEGDKVIFSHIGKYEERKSSNDIFKVFTYALEGIDRKFILIANMYNQFDKDWLVKINKDLLGLEYNLFKADDTTAFYCRSNLTVIIPKAKIRDISDIYKQSHFGLYLSKAEGWNLPLIESIASGIPCVTTNYSGQSEYLKDYPKELLITTGVEEIANDSVWFFGDKGNWKKPDLSSAKELIKDIGENPSKYLDFRDACVNSVKQFTWKNSALKFKEFCKNESISIVSR